MNYSTSTLYTGDRAACAARVEREIQNIFCPKNGCQLCSVCIRIAHRQYEFLVWLSPEKTIYTRAELDAVCDAARFTRSEQEPFVCVLEEVDRVSPAAGASLLKIVEEPPRGLYWMLTTQREHDVLPTLVSRSVIVPVYEQTLDDHEEFFLFFTRPHTRSFAQLHDLLEKHKLNEYESRVMFDKLFSYWVTQLEHDRASLAYVMGCREYLSYYPMPGSAKIFWRTLYAHMVSRAARTH